MGIKNQSNQNRKKTVKEFKKQKMQCIFQCLEDCHSKLWIDILLVHIILLLICYLQQILTGEQLHNIFNYFLMSYSEQSKYNPGLQVIQYPLQQEIEIGHDDAEQKMALAIQNIVTNLEIYDQVQPKQETKKSYYAGRLMHFLQNYNDNDLIGELLCFIKKHRNQIQFNKKNLNAIQSFFRQNHEDNRKLGLFIQIFMEISHLKDNGMLYMFDSLCKINQFLRLIEQPEFRKKYLEVVVNKKLICIFSKCSNKRVISPQDLQDIITLKDCDLKNLKIILDRAKFTTIHHLANYLKQYPETFPTYFKQLLEYKKMILDIIEKSGKSNQVQSQKILKNDSKKQVNKIYKFVTENLISQNQQMNLNEILSNKYFDSKQQIYRRNQKSTPKPKDNLKKSTPQVQERPYVQQNQQECIIKIGNTSQMEMEDFQFSFYQSYEIPYGMNFHYEDVQIQSLDKQVDSLMVKEEEFKQWKRIYQRGAEPKDSPKKFSLQVQEKSQVQQKPQECIKKIGNRSHMDVEIGGEYKIPSQFCSQQYPEIPYGINFHYEDAQHFSLDKQQNEVMMEKEEFKQWKRIQKRRPEPEDSQEKFRPQEVFQFSFQQYREIPYVLKQVQIFVLEKQANELMMEEEEWNL